MQVASQQEQAVGSQERQQRRQASEARSGTAGRLLPHGSPGHGMGSRRTEDRPEPAGIRRHSSQAPKPSNDGCADGRDPGGLNRGEDSGCPRDSLTADIKFLDDSEHHLTGRPRNSVLGRINAYPPHLTDIQPLPSSLPSSGQTSAIRPLQPPALHALPPTSAHRRSRTGACRCPSL